MPDDLILLCTRVKEKYQQGLNVKPRPLKLVTASEAQKDRILQKAKNLKDQVKNGLNLVFIHQDLTPKQRMARHQLVDELKARKLRGETNLIIVKGKIVIKGARPNQTNT